MRIKKKILLIMLYIWITLIIWNFSYAKDYEFKNLDIQANIKIDWTIDIQETFTTNFLESRHWIIRIIPLNYSVKWENFHINVSDVYVKWSKFTTYKKDWNIEIKIWDANRFVYWEEIYPISYATYWLIRNFSWMWYSELYWNLVGYDFDTNIDSVRAEILLPKKNYFTSDDFLITTNWSTSFVWDFGWKVDWSKWDRITITYDKPLSARNWITLAVKFPNNYFIFDNKKQKDLLWYVKDEKNRFDFNEYSRFEKAFLCIVWVLIFSFLIRFISNLLRKRIAPVKIWKKFGINYPIIVQYTPPKWINSSEAWLIFNCRVDPIDMTSLFYQWKNDKIIAINCVKKSPSSNDIQRVIITKLKDIPDESQMYEKDFFHTIFRKQDTVILDKNTKLNFLSSLYALEDYGIRKKWLCRRKKTSFLWYLLFILLTLCLIPLFQHFGWIWVLIWIFVVPMIYGISINNDYKIKLTDEWAKLASYIIWYAKFIKECDENQLRLFLEQDPLYVDKILPYAVAFGLEAELLKKATPLMKELEKNWITWNLIDIWNMINFMKTSVIFMHPKSSAIIPLSLLTWVLSGVSFDSDGWFSSWSSFWGWFSSGWWGGWWGSRSR